MLLTLNNKNEGISTSNRISKIDPCLTMSFIDNESSGHHMHADEAGCMVSSVSQSLTITSVDASYMSGSVPCHSCQEHNHNSTFIFTLPIFLFLIIT